MLTDRVRRVLGAVFNRPVDQIPEDASIMTLPGWDSLGHAQLMLALEEEFSIELPTEVVIELQSVPEIVEYLAVRGSPDAGVQRTDAGG